MVWRGQTVGSKWSFVMRFQSKICPLTAFLAHFFDFAGKFVGHSLILLRKIASPHQQLVGILTNLGSWQTLTMSLVAFSSDTSSNNNSIIFIHCRQSIKPLNVLSIFSRMSFLSPNLFSKNIRPLRLIRVASFRLLT